jgi:hypothetical protein
VSSSIELIRRTAGRESLPILRTHEKIRQEIQANRRDRRSVCASQESAFHATSVGHTQGDVGMPFGYPWISIPSPAHYRGGQVQGLDKMTWR